MSSWSSPRLGEPIMRHRGRFCYVSAHLLGPKTGTPEEGIDATFILYAGPIAGR